MIKTYDFKSPKKFTKERMSLVENLYDSFSRALAPYMTGLLQSFCEISITDIEEKRYQEFASTIESRSLFGLMSLSPDNKDYNEAPLMMEVDTRLGFYMVERLLGGAGTEYKLSRDFTDIEKAILQYIFGQITEFIGMAWNEYLDVSVTLTGIQTNAHLLQMSAPEDLVVEVGLELSIDNLRAPIRLVMHGPNVDELTSKLGYSFVDSQKKKKDDAKRRSKRDSIEQHLLESEVEIRAIMQEFQLDAHDVLELRVGDVVPINMNINEDVTVYVGDMACFEAKLGQTKLRKAVEISREL